MMSFTLKRQGRLNDVVAQGPFSSNGLPRGTYAFALRKDSLTMSHIENTYISIKDLTMDAVEPRTLTCQ